MKYYLIHLICTYHHPFNLYKLSADTHIMAPSWDGRYNTTVMFEVQQAGPLFLSKIGVGSVSSRRYFMFTIIIPSLTLLCSS